VKVEDGGPAKKRRVASGEAVLQLSDEQLDKAIGENILQHATEADMKKGTWGKVEVPGLDWDSPTEAGLIILRRINARPSRVSVAPTYDAFYREPVFVDAGWVARGNFVAIYACMRMLGARVCANANGTWTYIQKFHLPGIVYAQVVRKARAATKEARDKEREAKLGEAVEEAKEGAGATPINPLCTAQDAFVFYSELPSEFPAPPDAADAIFGTALTAMREMRCTTVLKGGEEVVDHFFNAKELEKAANKDNGDDDGASLSWKKTCRRMCNLNNINNDRIADIGIPSTQAPDSGILVPGVVYAHPTGRKGAYYDAVLAYRARFRAQTGGGSAPSDTPAASGKEEEEEEEEEVEDGTFANFDPDSAGANLVFLLVLNFVDAPSIRAFAQASRAFRIYASQPRLWGMLITRDIGTAMCANHLTKDLHPSLEKPVPELVVAGRTEQQARKQVSSTTRYLYKKHLSGRATCIKCVAVKKCDAAVGSGKMMSGDSRRGMRGDMEREMTEAMQVRTLLRMHIIRTYAEESYSTQNAGNEGRLLALVRTPHPYYSVSRRAAHFLAHGLSQLPWGVHMQADYERNDENTLKLQKQGWTALHTFADRPYAKLNINGSFHHGAGDTFNNAGPWSSRKILWSKEVENYDASDSVKTATHTPSTWVPPWFDEEQRGA
jgi:uncharacterized protein YjiS (DUF1127 family)